MKAVWTVIIVVIVLAVVGYGGYKMYHHMSRQSVPAQTVMTHPAMKTQPTMASNSVYKVMSSGKLGSIFTDTKGMTLYTYKKDTSGISNCSGGCLKAWPSFVSSSAAGIFPTGITVIKRTNGTLQYAWKGMPLYYYVGDKKIGDVNGEGIEGVWDVVKQ